MGTFQHFRAMRTFTQDQTTTNFINEHFSSSSTNSIETWIKDSNLVVLTKSELQHEVYSKPIVLFGNLSFCGSQIDIFQ